MLYFNKNKKKFSILILVFFTLSFYFNFLNTTFAQPGDPVIIPTPGPLGTTTITPTATDSAGSNATHTGTGTGTGLDGTDKTNILPSGGANVDTDTTYTPLAPLTGELEGPYQTDTDCPLGKYLGILFNLFMGIAAVLAMIMIFAGGIEYMGSELISSKEAGMSKVKNAIFGLLLALAAYLILDTINPALLNVCLNIKDVEVTISPFEENTGSGAGVGPGLCIDSNAPDPNTATGSSLNSVSGEYAAAMSSLPNIPPGIKLLMEAQTAMEGFKGPPAGDGTGTVAYRTNNPGNIGNIDIPPAVSPRTCNPQSYGTKCYASLAEGIAAQYKMYEKIGKNTAGNYKIGGEYTCALGPGQKYDGSLYQYLRIYSTDARDSNNYLNAIIGYFASKGKTIGPNTKMSDIFNMK